MSPIVERTRQAVAGTLHNVLYGKLDVEFHASLLDNEELLDRVASRNARMNGLGGRRGRTYMLSQVMMRSVVKYWSTKWDTGSAAEKQYIRRSWRCDIQRPNTAGWDFYDGRIAVEPT